MREGGGEEGRTKRPRSVSPAKAPPVSSVELVILESDSSSVVSGSEGGGGGGGKYQAPPLRVSGQGTSGGVGGDPNDDPWSASSCGVGGHHPDCTCPHTQWGGRG